MGVGCAGKANLSADTLAGKRKLLRLCTYTECAQSPELQAAVAARQWSTAWLCLMVSAKRAPPVRLHAPHNCAQQLARPMQSLLQRMIETASFPESWRVHWVVPIYRKKAGFSASNYRGVHLTAQLSKVAERLLLPLVEPHIGRAVAFGPNQFAYTKGRGARDALAYLMISWLLALNRRRKSPSIARTCPGAFDRVQFERLLEKLRSKGSSPYTGRCGGFLAAATYCTGGRGWPALCQDAPQHGFSRAPCQAPSSGTSSTRTPGARSMRQAS